MKRKIVIATVGLVGLAGLGATIAIAERHHDGRGERGGWSDGMGRGEMDGHEMRRGRGGRGGKREITKDDMMAKARARFAEIDVNGDGVIDQGEIEDRMKQRMERRIRRRGARGMRRMERRMARLDTDRNGSVSAQEFKDHIAKRFDRMDLNSDGQITDDDLPPRARGRDILSGGSEMGRGRGRHKRMLRMLRQANTNGDNAVTRDEVVAFGDKRFARMDRNKDGVLNAEDRTAAMQEGLTYRVTRFLHRFDAVKDQQVSREVFLKHAEERFTRRDANADGVLSGDEVRRGRGKRRGGKRGWGRGGEHHGRGHRGEDRGDRRGGGRMERQGFEDGQRLRDGGTRFERRAERAGFNGPEMDQAPTTSDVIDPAASRDNDVIQRDDRRALTPRLQ